MSDMTIVATPGSRLHRFLFGTKFAEKYARRALPVLVQWVEEEKFNRRVPNIREHTYQELATILGDVSKTHPMQSALGALGFALEELQECFPKEFGKRIPPIELLVWTKGAKRPGDSGFSFIGVSKKQVQKLPELTLQKLAAQTRQEILAYPHWRKVLKVLHLQPLTLRLPNAESIKKDPSFCGLGGGESLEHERLKEYIKRNYGRLGLAGRHSATLEKILLSGDKIDVLLEHISNCNVIGIEAKSRISSDADLIRGVFQCVKYQSVLEAEEEYLTSQDKTWIPRAVAVLLVTERALPSAIANLAERLGVLHSVVFVPDSFSIPS